MLRPVSYTHLDVYKRQDMDYVGFWHATRSEAPYVCIEPWSSLPSRQDIVEDLSTQPGLKSVQSGGVYRNSWSVEIR